MRITVFTSSHPRHRYLIYSLSKFFDQVLYINEDKPYIRSKKSKTKNFYFKKVKKTEKKIFGKVNLRKKNIKKYSFKYRYINYKKLLKDSLFINSDYFLVFGSSLIKNQLLNYLIKKKAINLHMGLLPYYRGTDCNFWAVHDNNKDKVGASLIYLSKKIDAGKVIKIFKSKQCKNNFKLTMNACKNSLDGLVKFLSKNKKKFTEIKMDKNKLKRFSSFNDFNDLAIKKYLNFKN